ncbi:hypothetical protein [Natronocalculus amylovorans]|uniref:Uncharacterized protein n=1 Tax=Natronocalculus amylovorans TaxID=2917812 RepID=A0AAE3FTL0_9EURY|nr:hypothetical protein [Natronocalculus amylovorans]MCL9815377.1 hypothetical protein [Natronocalculus amylovorans]NUE02109.1 hypothetical protein [Halorubraceae archaeon YAN]
MLEQLEIVCDADCCQNRLGEDTYRLSMTTVGGTQQVHECSCGALTITITKQ